jgi:hypothetical protein
MVINGKARGCLGMVVWSLDEFELRVFGVLEYDWISFLLVAKVGLFKSGEGRSV